MGKEGKVKAVVYVEISLFILGTVCYLLGILCAVILEDYVLKVFTNSDKEEDRIEMRSHLRSVFMVWTAFMAVCMLIATALLIVLYKGYKQRSAGKLKVWFYIVCVFTGLTILSIVSSIVMNPSNFTGQFVSIACAVYRIWALVAVKGFINEIQEGPQQQSFQGIVCEKA